MNQLQLKILLNKIADKNHVSYNDVYTEIENAIQYAYTHQTDTSKSFWSKFSTDAAAPTVFQVLSCILH